MSIRATVGAALDAALKSADEQAFHATQQPTFCAANSMPLQSALVQPQYAAVLPAVDSTDRQPQHPANCSSLLPAIRDPYTAAVCEPIRTAFWTTIKPSF